MTRDDNGTAAHVTPQLSDYARHVIDELGLAPHPEGGWYRRTWQSALAADATGDRPLASCIYFLLPAVTPARGTLLTRTSCGFGMGPVR